MHFLNIRNNFNGLLSIKSPVLLKMFYTIYFLCIKIISTIIIYIHLPKERKKLILPHLSYIRLHVQTVLIAHLCSSVLEAKSDRQNHVMEKQEHCVVLFFQV